MFCLEDSALQQVGVRDKETGTPGDREMEKEENQGWVWGIENVQMSGTKEEVVLPLASSQRPPFSLRLSLDPRFPLVRKSRGSQSVCSQSLSLLLTHLTGMSCPLGRVSTARSSPVPVILSLTSSREQVAAQMCTP